MKKHFNVLTYLFLLVLMQMYSARLYAQSAKPPIMGWSSWNHFRINIDEKMIKEQADALVSSGMYAAGYRYINIDDGFFGGRDSSGQLYANAVKFPSGMKSLAGYIHNLKLKAGIYTDAGRNTCGSIWDGDKKGLGVGIYGHLEQDCDVFFKRWGYDFIKVDWCGGEKMGLDEQKTYTEIINFIKKIDSDIVVNVCRWKFPGKWVVNKADSWRISGDISADFSSILKIIDINADLHPYSKPGSYNDMDMLQVGRGMNYEEDKTHFSMWCMLNSPLLAGNDLRNMSAQTISILTNKELIALNQDIGFVQAKRVYREGDVEIWLKPLGTNGKVKAIAILNRGSKQADFEFQSGQLGLSGESKLRDLWLHNNLGKVGASRQVKIPGHGVVVFKVG
ncbi:glycoside hydrolase family 27 protein [Pedobacter rhodius]|uniref:Alpha-galactosidase n=1 Tax=Pedobacter rhodius TaxID=3004098 RepID=A0ABT4KWG1_9SPHI|nr:glycoside hydrolase family 27 protein [Pedobacter sp. SJ11]MCZ4223260.1 glycoside hydrolase family 27 protein [Pedobacter sp. SJ11]